MGSNRDVPGAADQVVTSSLTVQPDRKRAEAVHRLQIGAAGIGAMILLIGLASVIMEKAQITEAASVPDAAATVEPIPSPTKNDPLAEAGVVPDMPAQDEQQTEQEQAIVPEQGDSAPAQ